MADEDLPAARPQVMPIFMGAPWAQRYGGPGSELSLSEWRAQVEYLAGLQGLSAPQTPANSTGLRSTITGAVY